jgi:hypothetical protein
MMLLGGLFLACGAERAQSEVQAPPAEVVAPPTGDAVTTTPGDAGLADAGNDDAGFAQVGAADASASEARAGSEVAPSGALALSMTVDSRTLLAGQNAVLTLTLKNTTSEPLDVPVPSSNWVFRQWLKFEPEVQVGRAPYYPKAGHFIGEVHTLAGGANENVTFTLHRTRDGKDICVLPAAKSEVADAEGCEQRLTLATNAAALKVRARFDDVGEGWLNLDYQSKRRNALAESNAVPIKLR